MNAEVEPEELLNLLAGERVCRAKWRCVEMLIERREAQGANR